MTSRGLDSTGVARRGWRGHRQPGFTLLELMVVMVIIGIIISLAVIQLREPGERTARRFARQLEARLTLARDESVLRGEPLGVALRAGGYRFLQPADDDRWQPLEGDRALGATRFPGILRLAVTLDGQAADTTGREHDGPRPTIVLYPSGEATAFTAILNGPNDRQGWQIQGSLDGRLTLDKIGQPGP